MKLDEAHSRKESMESNPAWVWLLPLSIVLAAAAIPFLLWYAVHAILNSADGSVSTAITDPTAPGYEALVLPSPSHMLFGLDSFGELSMVLITGLGEGDSGGSALLIAAETFANNTSQTLGDVYSQEGSDSARIAVASLIDINTDGITTLDASGWEQMVAPAGPISVDNPASLSSDSAGNLPISEFPAGNIVVEPSQTSLFLGWQNIDESPEIRLLRQKAFLQAWLATIATSEDPGVIPGELNEGIGRMLQGLASGPVNIEITTGNVTETEGGDLALQVDLGNLRSVVTEIVPFPLPAVEGARPLVRLLDGVGGLDLTSFYAPALVRAGAQIVVIGNAVEFGVSTTEVVYHQLLYELQAQMFGLELGGAVVTMEPQSDGPFDVTIVIGEDQR